MGAGVLKLHPLAHRGPEKGDNNLITTRKIVVKQYKDFQKHFSSECVSHIYLRRYMRTLLCD